MLSLCLFMLLVPPCANIAILIYARTVTRSPEFAVRYALGASRGRIVADFRRGARSRGGGRHSGAHARSTVCRAAIENHPSSHGTAECSLLDGFQPSFKTVFCVAGLALLAAAIAGGVPALEATGRRREIGVRSALGAQPRRLVAGIFGRALVPVAVGGVVGSLVALLINYYVPIAEVGGLNIPGIVPASAVFMIVIGLLAVAGPARRAIRVNPMEALRDS